MMAKTRNIEVGTVKAFIPWQGQRAHAASETDAKILQTLRRYWELLQQCRSGTPHRIRSTTTEDIRFALANPVQHMPKRIAGHAGTGTAGDAACTGEDYRGPWQG